MSISGAISASVTGLQINQQESALIAQNIASASTPGYTNKVLSVTDNVSPEGLTGMIGVVQRQINTEVQQQLNTSTSATSYLSTQNTYATNVDQLFGTPGATNTLEGAISGLTSALSTLQASPSDQSAQQGAVSAAQTMAQTLNQMSSGVQTLRTQADGEIADGVAQVNTLTQNISDLNNKIVSGTAAGTDITNLEDQRDLDVNKLSSYIDVQTRTTSTGAMNVFTTAGQQLVGAQATKITFNQSGVLTAGSQYVANSSQSNVGAITVGSGDNTVDLISTGQIRSGSLAALVNERDVVLPKAQNQLDDLAASISGAFSDTTTKGTIVTSGSNSGQSVDLTGIQNGNPINLSYTDSNGKTRQISLIPTSSASNLPLPQSLSNDPNVKVVGFDNSGGNTATAAATALQAALGSSFTVTNPGGNTLQVLNAGSTAAAVAGLSVTTTQTQTQGGTATFPLFTVGSSGPAYTGNYTTGSQKTGLSSVLSVNSAVLSNPALLVAYSSTTLSGDPTRPTAMLTAFTTDQSTYGPETGIVSGTGSFKTTISGLANQMTSYWGAQSANSTTALSSQQVIQNNLQSSYTTTSTVSLDNQLAQLVQIQSAYTANARVMTIAQAMLTTLMQIQV
jgi:flagellar hook-associated protein 1 FlgK